MIFHSFLSTSTSRCEVSTIVCVASTLYKYYSFYFFPNISSHFHYKTTSPFDPSNQPIIAFITSNKKRRLLVIDGFIFQQNKSTDKATYWICQEKMCDMGVHLTKNDSFIKFTKSNHTHMPASEKLEIRKMLIKVKSLINSEATAVSKIYTEEICRKLHLLLLMPLKEPVSRKCVSSK